MRQRRRYPRGDLDRRAAVMLALSEARTGRLWTLAEIAEDLGCSEATLADRRRCPQLARVRDAIEARKWDYYRPGDRGGRISPDRRRKGLPRHALDPDDDP